MTRLYLRHLRRGGRPAPGLRRPVGRGPAAVVAWFGTLAVVLAGCGAGGNPAPEPPSTGQAIGAGPATATPGTATTAISVDGPAPAGVPVNSAALTYAEAHHAVPIRDGPLTDRTRYCPVERLSVGWTAPTGTYRSGAYLPPVGPAPSASTLAVNGVVTCGGSRYAYMGFEAHRDSPTAGWVIVPVPT
jgi:hypothetical protein